VVKPPLPPPVPPGVVKEKPRGILGSAADDEAEAHGRSVVRDLQNLGTTAYASGAHADSRGHFDAALHALKKLEDKPRKTEAPSRVMAERDGVRLKLLKYLSKSLEKLGVDAESKARFEEAKVIEKRLSEYWERRKRAGV